ncbi:hypothetical protein Hanom_Chr09g00817621 [Helianthus anomalus]
MSRNVISPTLFQTADEATEVLTIIFTCFSQICPQFILSRQRVRAIIICTIINQLQNELEYTNHQTVCEIHHDESIRTAKVINCIELHQQSFPSPLQQNHPHHEYNSRCSDLGFRLFLVFSELRFLKAPPTLIR